MRSIVLATIAALGCGPVHASSIEVIATGAPKSADSIVALHCTDCDTAPRPVSDRQYVAPVLAPGTQQVELKTDGAETRIVRTEAWLGGSPVVYVSKGPRWLVEDKGSLLATAAPAPAAGDGVDAGLKTAAVSPSETATSAGIVADPAAGAGGPAEVLPKPLDTSAFELRFR